MPATPARDQRRPLQAATVAAVCLLGFVTVALSALDLSAFGLANYLNSDFLTPYFFCSDLLSGHYPMSGWTLSASPYFVPDHLLLFELLKWVGRTGFAYALFTVVFYPLLFILAGFCIRTVVGRAGTAFVASLLFGNVLLALRALPGHARCLWWIGAPTCHGGVLLLGFAYLWTLSAGLRRGQVGWLPVGLFLLGFAGLLSDSLFLFQVLLPASVALFIGHRWYPEWEFSRWLPWQGGCGVAALLVAQLFKPLCQRADWFYFSRMIRVAPTPANQWHALGQFVSDLPRLFSENWGFALVLLAAVTLLCWRRKVPLPNHAATGETHPGTLNFYRLFCGASLFIMLPLPILSCGWRDLNNVRYEFNWFVLPGFLLALEAATRWHLTRRWTLGATAALFLICGGCALHGLRGESLEFPYPADVAALDGLLQRRGMKHGLAQYWDAKNITALSHAGAELRQLRPSGEPFFWDDNVFGYYERGPGDDFTWPAYQYILTNTLDESAVARVFGEPLEKTEAGHFRVWIYGPEGQQRIRAVLEPAVRAKLGPRRLTRL